jgi:uncharacterized membrane protein YeaQ/YmgE (transglycosylase-associated protein family)
MNFIIWLVIGGVVGWIASLIMRTDGQQGILLAIVNLFRRGRAR